MPHTWQYAMLCSVHNIMWVLLCAKGFLQYSIMVLKWDCPIHKVYGKDCANQFDQKQSYFNFNLEIEIKKNCILLEGVVTPHTSLANMHWKARLPGYLLTREGWTLSCDCWLSTRSYWDHAEIRPINLLCLLTKKKSATGCIFMLIVQVEIPMRMKLMHLLQGFL